MTVGRHQLLLRHLLRRPCLRWRLYHAGLCLPHLHWAFVPAKNGENPGAARRRQCAKAPARARALFFGGDATRARLAAAPCLGACQGRRRPRGAGTGWQEALNGAVGGSPNDHACWAEPVWQARWYQSQRVDPKSDPEQKYNQIHPTYTT